MTTGDRLTQISGLAGVTAAVMLLAIGAGATTGAALVNYSGLPSDTAEQHLLADSGSVVVFFSGISKADGPCHHVGISRPNLQLVASSGGRYTVTKNYNTQDIVGDSVSNTTYLIDGELP